MKNALVIFTLCSIWMSLLMSIVTLAGAVHFWLKGSKRLIKITPLKRYPKITLVVPAHNEAVVISKTTEAILNLNYPPKQVQLLLYADNCEDNTAQIMRATVAKYRDRDVQIIERSGSGGKAGVLNDALKIASGEYIWL